MHVYIDSESRSFFEILTGRGTVVASAGIGSAQVVKIEEIDNVTPVQRDSAKCSRRMLVKMIMNISKITFAQSTP
ncbi:MAG: hypothetical protein Ct9H300mP27_03790 [Chloroflexota bacterium]|nr:MAG: hypothetical protein Ct9H300mP27_03790 [Chloroflexota bacterium]